MFCSAIVLIAEFVTLGGEPDSIASLPDHGYWMTLNSGIVQIDSNRGFSSRAKRPVSSRSTIFCRDLETQCVRSPKPCVLGVESS